MRRQMKTGTKSLLFGAHQFLIHPLFVLIAWWRYYGRPSFRMLVAIVIHDWDYWNCKTMEGEEGSDHSVWAGEVLLHTFGWLKEAEECYHHSRFFAKRVAAKPSRLCWADKIGTASYPTSLWVLLTKLSGEAAEYINDPKYEVHYGVGESPWLFFRRYKEYAKSHFVEEAVMANVREKEKGD